MTMFLSMKNRLPMVMCTILINMTSRKDAKYWKSDMIQKFHFSRKFETLFCRQVKLRKGQDQFFNRFYKGYN